MNVFCPRCGVFVRVEYVGERAGKSSHVIDYPNDDRRHCLELQEELKANGQVDLMEWRCGAMWRAISSAIKEGDV